MRMNSQGLKKRYGDRQTTVYPGARGLGIMYLNQLGRVMRVRDTDASTEIFNYVISIAPDSRNAKRGLEKNREISERRPQKRFKKVLAEQALTI